MKLRITLFKWQFEKERASGKANRSYRARTASQTGMQWLRCTTYSLDVHTQSHSLRTMSLSISRVGVGGSREHAEATRFVQTYMNRREHAWAPRCFSLPLFLRGHANFGECVGSCQGMRRYLGNLDRDYIGTVASKSVLFATSLETRAVSLTDSVRVSV